MVHVKADVSQELYWYWKLNLIIDLQYFRKYQIQWKNDQCNNNVNVTMFIVQYVSQNDDIFWIEVNNSTDMSVFISNDMFMKYKFLFCFVEKKTLCKISEIDKSQLHKSMK